ncbi:hypothetical protein [Thermococcus sp.]|uniref:hypothetical protein n=1 Tax=Thermococcus sp. TaxID=35749 RepID=UPI00262844AE|nr:hypothetical protein [Thermococcus sp.]
MRKGRLLALLGLVFILLVLSYFTSTPTIILHTVSNKTQSSHTAQTILTGVYQYGPENGTLGAITFDGVRQLVKSGYGAVEVSILKPSEKKLALRPGQEVPVEVKITYLGGSKTPERIVLVLGKFQGIGDFTFAPAGYVNEKEVPPEIKEFKRPLGYNLPMWVFFRFDRDTITIEKNSSVIVTGYLRVPKFIVGGSYLLSPPVYVPVRCWTEGVVGTSEDSVWVTVG